MFGISAFSESPFSSLASSTHSGIASIGGTATITVHVNDSLVFGVANISGLANLEALGGFTAEAIVYINATATVTASAKAVFSGDAAISGTGAVTAIGSIQGNNWTVVPVGTNTWLRIG